MGEYVTLEDYRKVTGDDVDRNVIDAFNKSSFLLQNLPFHQAAASTGGSAVAYTYTRQKTQATAAFRALNADYVDSVVEVEQFTVDCKPFGGKFSVDRVLGAGNSTQVALQINAKVKAASALFSDAVINGGEDGFTNSFDGLSKALTGSSTEVDGAAIDWSAVDSQSGAFTALEALDALLAEVTVDGSLVIATNAKGKLKLQAIARQAGYLTHSEDAAGRPVSTYAGVPIVDLGAAAGTNAPVIPVYAGKTDFYVISMGPEGFHGVSPADGGLIKTYLPNFQTANAVHEGAVEMVATVALKNTKAAAVLRDVKIEKTT